MSIVAILILTLAAFPVLVLAWLVWRAIANEVDDVCTFVCFDGMHVGDKTDRLTSVGVDRRCGLRSLPSRRSELLLTQR
jgi:hypothetical protein